MVCTRRYAININPVKSFSHYLLSNYCVPDNTVGTGEAAMKKTDKSHALIFWKTERVSYQRAQADGWMKRWTDMPGKNHESLHRADES